MQVKLTNGEYSLKIDTAPLLTLTGQNVSIYLDVTSNIAKQQQTNSARMMSLSTLLGKVILKIGH